LACAGKYFEPGRKNFDARRMGARKISERLLAGALERFWHTAGRFGAIRMMPTYKDVQIGQRTCDSLRAHAHSVAMELYAEMNGTVAGSAKRRASDPTPLVSLYCSLTQLAAVVRRAIELGAAPVPPPLVELSRLIEGSLGPVMNCAICELDPDPQILSERAASASVSVRRLLEFTEGAGTRRGAAA
jgi:hypothetical protein